MMRELLLPKGKSFQLQRGDARHNAESKVPSTGSTGYSLRQAELSARKKPYADSHEKSRASLYPPPEGRGFTDKIVKKLTTEAWLLYLKILSAELIPDISMANVSRQYKLADRAYYRYRRRRASDA